MLKSRGFWIGIGISAVLIFFFVRGQDFGEVKEAFRDANYFLVALSLPVYFLGLWMRTIRWQYLLRPVKRISTIRLYPVVIIGLMANNLIPARVGEQQDHPARPHRRRPPLRRRHTRADAVPRRRLRGA